MRSSPESAKEDADREGTQIQLCCQEEGTDPAEVREATIDHLRYRVMYHRMIADHLEDLAARLHLAD
jgi:hypothetical protein